MRINKRKKSSLSLIDESGFCVVKVNKVKCIQLLWYDY